MKALNGNLQKITTYSDQMNATVASHRTNITNMSNTLQLLKKVKFKIK